MIKTNANLIYLITQLIYLHHQMPLTSAAFSSPS